MEKEELLAKLKTIIHWVPPNYPVRRGDHNNDDEDRFETLYPPQPQTPPRSGCMTLHGNTPHVPSNLYSGAHLWNNHHLDISSSHHFIEMICYQKDRFQCSSESLSNLIETRPVAIHGDGFESTVTHKIELFTDITLVIRSGYPLY